MEDSTKAHSLGLVLGLTAGAASWTVVALVSDAFEPFDSGLGLLLGQIALCTAAVFVGWRRGLSPLLLYLTSAYLAMNAYAYAFGGSESRAWFALGAVTTLTLMVLPGVSGLIGLGLRRRGRAAPRYGS